MGQTVESFSKFDFFGIFKSSYQLFIYFREGPFARIDLESYVMFMFFAIV